MSPPTNIASPGKASSVSSAVLDRLGLFDEPRAVRPEDCGSAHCVSVSPADGSAIGGVTLDTLESYNRTIEKAEAAQRQWRLVPGPKRGEIVRLMGEALREHCDDLGALVSMEMGKIKVEGVGEVQECIDIADFAVGLSRQLYGLTMPSERPEHRLMEQWHPLGTVGVITAFNFPIAVWAWNAMLAMACGDAVVWKPSLISPLIAVAATRVAHDVMRKQDVWQPTDGVDPCDLLGLVMGDDAVVGEAMTADKRLPLISATGSCRMGRIVAQKVAGRLGRCLLELGGNNAIILMPDADMDMALRGVVFGSVGTAGQRCTSTRRLLCVGDAADRITPKLVEAYGTVSIGDPLDPDTLMGPLIDQRSVDTMRSSIEKAEAEGCEVLCGGVPGIEEFAGSAGHYVRPTIIRVPKGKVPAITQEETFAPILYVFEFDSFEEALEVQNGVDQGLSSAVFTTNGAIAERFLCAGGSDCGIANVNLGTSGAEIGGAFGGEKDTGGGRESGSDAWKAYMRRQTCTVNYGSELPLAQGIEFGS